MRIVQLVFTLGSGGAAKFVVNLSNELAEMGHDVTVVQLRNDQIEEFDIHFNRKFLSENVGYVNLGLTRGYTLRKSLAVMRAITQLSPDIVNSHINLLPYYYPMSLCQSKIKFVHTLHNLAEKETSNRIQQKINRWFYKNKYIVPVTISDECRESFIKLYGVYDVDRVNNGCPIAKKTEDFVKVDKEIKSYKKSPQTKVFLHVARFGEAKNQSMLVSAFNKLVAEGRDIILIIIGDGFDSTEGKHLKDTACDRIHFLGVKSNVSDYLLNSDYFVMSSFWEGLPISLIEAMSVGLIPISTPAGGIVNVIKDEINGFLSQNFSEQSFINAIKRGLEIPIDKRIVIESYQKGFSMTQCALEYEKIYARMQ